MGDAAHDLERVVTVDGRLAEGRELVRYTCTSAGSLAYTGACTEELVASLLGVGADPLELLAARKADTAAMIAATTVIHTTQR
jgi:hypothetical protein